MAIWFESLRANGRATLLTTAAGRHLWVAAERLQEALAVFGGAELSPSIPSLPVNIADGFEAAFRELLRSRLEGLGPVTVQSLAHAFALDQNPIEQALAALEQQGIAVQGRFSPNCPDLEWCERSLLARIHRYTLKQLRQEIEPVAPADFMRFLFRWHGLHDPATGEASLIKALKQLEGCNLPAARWETDILPRRLKPYFGSELDQLCNSGQFAWLRLKPSAGSATPKTLGKTTPIALIKREHLPFWREISPLPELAALPLSGQAQQIYSIMQQWGASFFQELLNETGLLKTQLETALGELVASGLITSDSFQGLRTLVTPQHVLHRHSRRYRIHDPLAAAGRWSLLRPQRPSATDAYESVEHIARILLSRYGVVFRKLLDNEEGLPSWRELLYVYRRLEARGEIRGGRFVNGFAGEQFALPEALNALRDIRKQEKTGQLTVINCSDPLNLSGIVTPGERIPAIASQRLVYRDGLPQAFGIRDKVNFLRSAELDKEHQWLLKRALITNA